MRTLSELRDLLNGQFVEMGSWTKVGNHWGVNRGLVHLIAVKGYAPRTPAYIALFGLELQTNDTCPKCGTKIKPRVVRYVRPRRLQEMQTEEILIAFQNRTDDFSEMETRYKGKVKRNR